MCLGIPGQVVGTLDGYEGQLALVDVAGKQRKVNIGMLPENETHIGDYVLIHVGFAMSKVDEQEAEETLRVLKELGEYQNEFENFKITVD